jgi:hypothetical protein
MSTEDLSNLSLSAFLTQLMKNKDLVQNPKLQNLLDAAKQLDQKAST